MINVHAYDTVLQGQFKCNQVNDNTNKLRLFKLLFEKLNNTYSKRNLTLIINSMCTNSDNFQIENNMDATDILSDILLSKLYKDNENDMLPILEEQLADMSMGACPSGRTTRLFQIWMTLQS